MASVLTLLEDVSYETEICIMIQNIVHYNNSGKLAEYYQEHNFAVMLPHLEKQRTTCEIHQGRCPIICLQLQRNNHGLDHWSVDSVFTSIV